MLSLPIHSLPVAPFTGAWIEIMVKWNTKSTKQGRTLYGCVDWNQISKQVKSLHLMSHPLRVRGLKSQFFHNVLLRVIWSHPLRVRGLKSDIFMDWNRPQIVAPFTGAWIEIRSADNTQQFDVSRTLYGCVDWNIHLGWVLNIRLKVAPFTGAWIEIYTWVGY